MTDGTVTQGAGPTKIQATSQRLVRAAKRRLPLVHFLIDSSLWLLAIPTGIFLRFDFDWSRIAEREVMTAMGVSVVLQGIFGWAFGLYRRKLRYGGFDEVRVLAGIAFSVGLVSTIIWWGGATTLRAIPRSVPILAAILCLLGQITIRSIWRLYEQQRPTSTRMFLSSPDIGSLERDALIHAFDSGWAAPTGPSLDRFEADLSELCGWPGVAALSSGSAALHLALLVHGVKPGDEVFVSSFTFAASATCAAHVGATVRFIDSEQTSWNMNPELLAAELADAARRHRLPAAVVVVDLYGQCADYDAIAPLCAHYGVPLIEDSAEAMGATHRSRPAGTLGDAGVYSFNGNKIITTSGGGAFLSPDKDTADRVRYLASQARQPVAHYEHTEIGYTYRLSNLLAAMGSAQLARLPDMSARRLGINNHYRSELGGEEGLAFMPIAPWGEWNGWLTCCTFDSLESRAAVQRALDAANIETRLLWKPLHLQPVFANAPARVDGTSERLFDRGLCLPSGSVLTDSQVETVVELMKIAVRSH